MRIQYILFTIVLAIAGCQGSGNGGPADIVLTNAYVYTADESRTVAQAVAIRRNDIVYVGDESGVDNFIDDATEVRDMNGAMLMPGIHDMHIHALGTVQPDMCDLRSESYTLAALVPVLQQCPRRLRDRRRRVVDRAAVGIFQR